ncbi:PREDICTED: RING finger protein 122-like [Papilio xuthus]|uniref:RING finger protein 122-like n=1 Tax=Papilio xuthus TaxID=66420 RepID=A0A0N1IDX8_PAPXU|nr:PREDICTED: RING finger protein 122-like [Papilio xuthus]KPJ04699.1 RING finger protein 165 [Papilio xuthus]
MSNRKESNEEDNDSGVGWMVAAGVVIGAAASAIGYIVGKNSAETPQCNISSNTRQQPSQSQNYRSKVVTCEKCSICLDDMDVAVLPCRHSFHRKCIAQWLAMNGTCPTCRTPVR